MRQTDYEKLLHEVTEVLKDAYLDEGVTDFYSVQAFANWYAENYSDELIDDKEPTYELFEEILATAREDCQEYFRHPRCSCGTGCGNCLL